MLLASLGLYPDAQTWSIAVLLVLWLGYAAYGLPYLLLGMNAKEVVFSVIRVAAMFVVGAPLLEWIDLNAAAFYVGALNVGGMLVYMLPQLAPAAGLVVRGLMIVLHFALMPLRYLLGAELFDSCASGCGCGELSPAALIAKVLSGQVTNAIVQGLFDQENESVQSCGLLVFDSDEAVRARRVLMVATQKVAIFMKDMFQEVVSRYRLGYAQAKEEQALHDEIDQVCCRDSSPLQTCPLCVKCCATRKPPYESKLALGTGSAAVRARGLHQGTDGPSPRTWAVHKIDSVLALCYHNPSRPRVRLSDHPITHMLIVYRRTSTRGSTRTRDTTMSRMARPKRHVSRSRG